LVHAQAGNALNHPSSVVGEVAGLDGDGALLLRDGDGTLHRVRSGAVDLVPAHDP
jgi:hypothetical protein